ncbi:MAG: serine hydroxymethyltransferase, partial [Actinophytocola sp.]|nr:serine hydroxymethyltransferase [Actinophytocola sp.]
GNADFAEVADIIATALKPELDDSTRTELRTRVERLAAKHPLYPEM